MYYHIIKRTRLYDGKGYDGPTCKRANVEPGKTYTDVEDAIGDAFKLTKFNPVGFEVIQTKLMQDENGHEYYVGVAVVYSEENNQTED